MSASVHVITTGTAPAVMLALDESLSQARIKPVIGRAVVNRFRSHLFEANRTRPNALGGARTGFYAEAARATHFTETGEGVQISVNQVGIRQRVLGGTIKPRTKKFLTIPVAPEAHGKRASEFPDLVVIWDRHGRPVGLGERDITQIGVRSSGRVVGGSASGMRMLFRLARQATQQPDPSVVPSTFEIAATAISAVNSHVDRAVERARARRST